MYKGKLKFLLIIITAVCSLNINAQQVSKTGTTAAKFLSIGVGPRGNSMGAAFSAVANDASAMYWNPAGIAHLNENQGMFSYSKLFADIYLNYFGIVLNSGDLGNFGVNITSLNMGEMEVTTENYPEGTGEKFSAGSFALGVSYARFITEDFIVGVNIKYIREDIFNSSANGFGVDIGTIFTTPLWGIKIASSITNFGTKMRITGQDLLVRFDQDQQRSGSNETMDAYLSTDEFELPLKLQIGLTKDFAIMENNRLTIAVDGNHPNDNHQYVNAGAELALFNEIVSIRGGYKSLFLDESQEGLTLGVGIKYSGFGKLKLSVDYAFQELEYLDNMHSFGVIVSF